MAVLDRIARAIGTFFGVLVVLASVVAAAIGLLLSLVVGTAFLWVPLLVAWGIDVALRHFGLWSNYWLVLAAVAVLLIMAVPKQKDSASVESTRRSDGDRDEP